MMRAATRILTLFVAFLLSTAAPSLAQQAKKPKADKSIPSRTWSCHMAGGLIDGSCVGLKDDNAWILTDSGQRVLVPLELFEAGQRKEILEFFEREGDVPAPGEKKGQPAKNGHPWHSSRGGVMVMGRIVGRQKDTLLVDDDQGNRYRVPYSLLASGAQDHARNAVTQLEGKPYRPSGKPSTASTPIGKPPGASSSHVPSVPTPPPTMPAPPTTAAPAPPTAPPTASPPAIPGLPPKKPGIGEVRAWKTRFGPSFVKGKFVELLPDCVVVELENGAHQRMPLDLLADADRKYAEVLSKGGKPAEVPAGAVAVESESARLSWSLDRKSMLLLDGRNLKILSADGASLQSKHALEAETLMILERPEYYVAACGKELQLLDKTTLKPKAKHDLWKYRRIRDMTLHPRRRAAILSIDNAVDEVRKDKRETQRIVIVDEKTGDFVEPEECFGTWVVADPTGKYLFAGFKDVRQSGASYHMNPGLNLIEIPKWDNTDILYRFRIERNGLKLDDTFRNAGANGQGLVLSPDGKRITYLSFTGYPSLSGNVNAFDVANFKKKPVIFAMKDRSDCKRMVYHPVLDVVASPADGSALCYDAKTGQPQPDRLAEKADTTGVAVHDLMFSAGGGHLVMVISKGGGARYLQSAALRLSAEETARIRTGAAPALAAKALADEGSSGKTAPPNPFAPPERPAVTARTWTDASGSYRVEATFDGLENNNVRLMKKDGRVIRVPLAKLSDEDRQYVESLGGDAAKE